MFGKRTIENNGFGIGVPQFFQASTFLNRKRSGHKPAVHFAIFGLYFLIAGCANTTSSRPFLMLAHDADGVYNKAAWIHWLTRCETVVKLELAGVHAEKSDAQRTIEHSAKPVWVAVRDGNKVEVQLDDFLINLRVLGEPEDEHPQRERFGGTSEVVMWRANLMTDGTFNAVWF